MPCISYFDALASNCMPKLLQNTIFNLTITILLLLLLILLYYIIVFVIFIRVKYHFSPCVLCHFVSFV
ncbi:hypothetical protein HanPI659440_Chr01g0030291 [Helianthus annuus]|nr:hypothetical protein HanPI659440_Chr01g0030291 [Helianthus annuus]